MVSTLLLVVRVVLEDGEEEWLHLTRWRGGCCSWFLDEAHTDVSTDDPGYLLVLRATAHLLSLGPWTQKALEASRRAVLMDAGQA